MASNPLFSTLRNSCEPRLHWGQAMCFAVVALVVACATIGAVRELKTEPAVVTWHQVATSDFVPLEAVVLLRLACTGAALYTLLRVYFDTVGIELRYLDAKVKLIRLRRWTTFTVWCFTLLFFYFALATFCSTAALLSRGDLVPYAVVVLTLILFEISYPTSLLVTAVVAFILLPAALKNHYPTARMFRWRPLMMHNGNVIMMQLAMLMTTPPVVLAHLPYALLFGCAYAVFAWYWFVRTGVFYYFFLDYRRPYAALVYIALLAVLALFYGLAYLIAVLVTQEHNRWWAYPCVLLGTWSMLRCRAPNANRQTPAFMKRLFS